MSIPKAVLFIIGLLLGVVQQAFTQKYIEVRDQTWLGYFNQTRLTEKSGLWMDLHFRLTDDFINEKTIGIARFAYIYYLSDHVRLMAGYAYATRYSNVGVGRIPEHRPWQQILWVEKKKGFNLTQAFRVEQRFRRNIADSELADDYNFNWRFRYNFTFTVPLKGKEVVARTPFLLFNNEIHINAGKNVVHNYFDQNRLFMGLGYQFTSHMNAHLGYLFIFQQAPASGHYLHINAIRLFVTQNFDFRKKD